MDSPHKLKIKVGRHEFEAEGTAEAVQQQFEAFKELVALAASTPEPMSTNTGTKTTEMPRADAPANGKPLSKIIGVEDRIVSLTIRPGDVFDAMLLILYGQKELRQNDSVTGAEIMDGLTRTGGFSYVKRVDRYLENLAKDGGIIVMGEHRAKRYRLTNDGYTRAVQLANKFLSVVP